MSGHLEYLLGHKHQGEGEMVLKTIRGSSPTHCKKIVTCCFLESFFFHFQLYLRHIWNLDVFLISCNSATFLWKTSGVRRHRKSIFVNMLLLNLFEGVVGSPQLWRNSGWFQTPSTSHYLCMQLDKTQQIPVLCMYPKISRRASTAENEHQGCKEYLQDSLIFRLS